VEKAPTSARYILVFQARTDATRLARSARYFQAISRDETATGRRSSSDLGTLQMDWLTLGSDDVSVMLSLGVRKYYSCGYKMSVDGITAVWHNSR
jgi:hypothetical protein